MRDFKIFGEIGTNPDTPKFRELCPIISVLTK